MTFVGWLVFVAAAVLEVAGNAAIHRGVRGGGVALAAGGALLLGGYGLLVNAVPWSFSRLFGMYVAAFAVLSVLCGRFVFGEAVPKATWAGLALIVAGSLVVQMGAQANR